MSGFLPDIASWALGGQPNGDGNDEQGNDAAAPSPSPASAPVSDEEMRAKRMARLAALEKKDSTASGASGGGDNGGAEALSMDVDHPSTAASAAQPMDVDSQPAPTPAPNPPPPKPPSASKDVDMEPAPKKKAKNPPNPLDLASKLRRKKIILLRRVLLVTFGDNPSDRTASCVHLRLDDDDMSNPETSPRGVQIRHIAEVLAARLSLGPSSRSLETVPSQTKVGVVAYLGGCHKRAGEELKELRQGRRKEVDLEELCGILEEIRNQVVSYAASSLMVPDLFELGSDAPLQLAKCLSTTSTDPASSITFDVLGKNTSFYYSVCEELHSQDEDAFATVVGDVVKHIADSLSKVKSVLDEGLHADAGVSGSGLFLASALRELCTNKKAAVALARLPSFLLPPADSPAASEVIRTPRPTTPDEMMRYMEAARRGEAPPLDYARRSGPGLESHTVLGLVLRLGIPRDDPAIMSAFSNPATRPVKDVNQTVDSFRRQLELYQSKCNELVKGLVVAGEEPRKAVLQWITDALLLNVNADAEMGRDRSKASSEELTTNLSVVLLKLCDPFVNDPKKAQLVDPGFVCAPESHGGVYALTGDNAIPRLGENVTNLATYSPKNAFIPACFFFCSRSLALSVVPGESRYENVRGHVGRRYHRVRQENGDYRSDRRFNMFLIMQHSMEIVLMSPSYITDVFRFYNMAAGLFLKMEKDDLKTMPEHIVTDYCSILTVASGSFPKLMSGVDLGNLYRLTAMLLTKDYESLVRNYNVRAQLGDVLHDVFLPGTADSRTEVPDSVMCDPLAGGRPYLTSDPLSIETLAPSLLLLYGEVESTGSYDKCTHRTKIAAVLKFLWSSPDHKPAFKKIADDEKGFITFANGIVNEMNARFADVMTALPSIRTVELQMANAQEWARLSEEDREPIMDRHADNERLVQHYLPLCNSVLKMLGYLNTDKAIRDMFLLPDMCPRLANMLLHVLNKLVGTRGLDLKVDNPERYNFRPKEMLQNLCVVFSSFAAEDEFQKACAKSGHYTPELMSKSVKTCRKLGLLVGESMELFALLATKVEEASKAMVDEEALYEDAPDEFLDPLMQEFMTDPVLLPTSDTIVDRKTIQQHLLNDDTDPFNRKQLSIDDVVPAVELKARMTAWLSDKRAAKGS